MWHRPDNKTTETRSANAQKSSLILPFPQNQSIQAVNPSLRNLGLYTHGAKSALFFCQCQAITMLYFYVKRPLILQDTGPH